MTARNALMSAEFVDQYGISGTLATFVTVDDTQTVAAMLTDLAAWEAAIEPLSQATIHQYSIKVIIEIPDPAAGVGDIEKGALFNFTNATDAYVQGYLVPDVNPTVLNAQGLVDLTNADVTTFVTWMTTAHTVITAVTKGVRALNGLKDALIAFRKHRKPLSRKTKEIA